MFEYEIQIPSAGEKKAETRMPFPVGTIIIDEHGIEYTIRDDAVGYGGSSIVYKVSRSGSLRNWILKECYPRSDGFFFHDVMESYRLKMRNQKYI